MADKGKFSAEEAGSLVENNLVVSASMLLEQSFSRYLESALQMEPGWEMNILRATIAFGIYNALKTWALLSRDKDGWTKLRKAGAWVWTKLFGE